MYSLLFVSVGLLSWFIQWRKGLDTKIPSLQLSLSLAFHIFLFMLFMKLPLWGEANTEHIASQRLLLTGVIGTLLASVISKHLLGIGYQRLDHAALSFPLVVIFSKVGAVIAELGRQPQFARNFFIEYQDRILFGKDAYNPEEYYTYFRVLETADEYFPYYKKYHAYWKMYGLNLPDEVLRKVYYKNALRIIPRIDASLFPKD